MASWNWVGIIVVVLIILMFLMMTGIITWNR